MAGLCKAMIIGYLGKDPEMRFTPNGKPVTSFSVAASRTYTVEGERRKETEWFRVSAWDKLAEICSQYLKKGSLVYVEGRLQTRQWETPDGRKGVSLELRASELQILDSREKGEGTEAGTDDQAGSDMDTIPF